MIDIDISEFIAIYWDIYGNKVLEIHDICWCIGYMEIGWELNEYIHKIEFFFIVWENSKTISLIFINVVSRF